jgi:hypothetical protein
LWEERKEQRLAEKRDFWKESSLVEKKEQKLDQNRNWLARHWAFPQENSKDPWTPDPLGLNWALPLVDHSVDLWAVWKDDGKAVQSV